MRKITTVVYNFNELSEDAKNVAVDAVHAHRVHNAEFHDTENFIASASELCRIFGTSCAMGDIYYNAWRTDSPVMRGRDVMALSGRRAIVWLANNTAIFSNSVKKEYSTPNKKRTSNIMPRWGCSADNKYSSLTGWNSDFGMLEAFIDHLVRGETLTSALNEALRVCGNEHDAERDEYFSLDYTRDILESNDDDFYSNYEYLSDGTPYKGSV